MAKLGAYYGLCPLIDHKSLLGISEGEEKGTVIVTLGKNISIEHKLTDQKQLHSWRTKEKFTSPVIYDGKQSKYAAVFNQTCIRLWTKEDEHVDKLKKLKFTYQIHTLFSCNGQTFLLFKNGVILPLQTAIESRKELDIEPVIGDEEHIKDVLYAAVKEEVYVGLLVENNAGKIYLLWTIHNEETETKKWCKVLLERDCLELNGYVFHTERGFLHFLTLWSDGRVFSNILQPAEMSVKLSRDLFTAIDSVDHKQPVSLVSLDENYMAMYGADCNGEGATLIIYNVQFKVSQIKQALKLFTKEAKLWCLQNNLVLPIGQNLAVIPYYLDTERLASLVGSHELTETETDGDVSIVQELEIADWGEKASRECSSVPKVLQNKISEFCKQGLPESLIVERLSMEFLENMDLDLMFKVSCCFSDIPEKSLVNFLKLTLDAKTHSFKNQTKSNNPKLPVKLEPLERVSLLDVILSKPFNDVLILPLLRAILDIDSVLVLIEYISYMLSENGHCLPNLDSVETEKKMIEWASVLLDSSFQKLLLTKDENVILVLDKLRELVGSELELLNGFSDLSALLRHFSKGKKINKHRGMANHTYSIESINLY